MFTQLSVADNLLLAGYDLPRGERNARVEEALSFISPKSQPSAAIAAVHCPAGSSRCWQSRKAWYVGHAC